MIKKKNWEDYGVSEVVGTILILGMTVTLFSVVLIWIYTIPTPSPGIKVDFDGALKPIYKDGEWDGVNITLLHKGGEALMYFSTEIFIRTYHGNQIFTDKLKLKGTMTWGIDNGRYYGLIDGNDDMWNTGERWSYTNHSMEENDRVEVMITDIDKNVLLWQRVLQGLLGLNPPVFIEKWADKDPDTPTINTPETGSEFTIFAKVVDPDDDINKQSVYVTIAAFFGINDYRENPQKMLDDGTGGDAQANDDIFTFTASWLIPQNLSWDGSVVLFNATDMAGHKTYARMTLSVILGSGGSVRPPRPPNFSGAPPNLQYNGLQGFNLFNATEWDYDPYNATDTRTFKEGETVVVVVASALLKNARGAHNEFYLYDPFSNIPPEPVVYGTIKIPGIDTQASNIQAFQFFQYVNGYNVFTYRFELNNASTVGINYYLDPTHPPNYWFARYPLEIIIWDDVYPMPSKFHTTDTINITNNAGQMRQYPKLETFKNSGFTIPSNKFNHTDVVYVRITMKSIDSTYYLGNVVIQDYIGGTQVWKGPIDGRKVNQPICPVTGSCTTGAIAVEMHAGSISYRFALNLSLVNQDPWVPGVQNYALRILSIRDTDEEYTLALQSQLEISAPAFALDISIANDDTSDNAWGTHDLGYYFEDNNGWDRWTKYRVFTGTPPPNAWLNGQATRFLDFDMDGDLDIAMSIKQNNQNSWLYLFRRDLDTNGNTVWTPFILENTGNELITTISTGSIDKDTAPEIVVGTALGKVWYYKNDGSWTKVSVDISRTTAINSIDLGDFDGDRDIDIAVARNAGKVTWYPNLDGYGKFTTTQQTDYWKAEQENTVLGSIVTGDYTYTHQNDANREQLQEEAKTFPSTYSNDTANADYQTLYGAIFSGSYLDTKTQNDVSEVIVEMEYGQGTKKRLQHTWTILVPQGQTHKFKIDSYKSTPTDDDFRFYYSTDPANLLANYMFTVTNTSDQDWYNTYNLPGGLSGTVYITVTDSQQSNGEIADRINVDHMYVETYIPGGDRSAAEHYWKLVRLPNRPGSTYTLYVVGYRTDPGTEGDNFNFYYSISGQSGPYIGPTITLNQGTETTYSYSLPATMGGQEVWIKVTDADRTNGKLQLASLYVNVLNITVQTPAGITGVDINLPDAANAMTLDAGDQNNDKYDDVAVGTSAGNVYKITGSVGGLVPPTAAFASPGGIVTGIKFADTHLTQTGLEIVASSGVSIYIYTGGGNSGTLLKTLTTPNSEQTTTLGAGDVDGDGDDDIVVGTGGNNVGRVVYFRNNNGNWVYPNPPGFILGVKIWSLDLGDVSDSGHRGR